MTRVLVTGGGGFIGHHACQILQARGLEVISVGRQDGDLANPDQARHMVTRYQPDILLHLAWVTDHGHFWTAPENEDWADAGKAMLEQFFNNGGSRAVIAGTCAEYDWIGAEMPLAEQAPLAPHTLYGQSKTRLFRHAEALITGGADICWGRLFLLYGPHETTSRFVPNVIKALLANETAYMSPGHQIRDFMHAKDAGAAFAQACLTPGVTGAVNIGQGEEVSLLRVAEMLQEIIGKGRLDPGHYAMRGDDPPILIPDIGRLRREIGFQSEFSLESGLEDVVRWWIKNGDS